MSFLKTNVRRLKKILFAICAVLLLTVIILEPFGAEGIINAKAQSVSADSGVLTKMQNWQNDTVKNSGLAVQTGNIESSVYNLGHQTRVANVIKKAMRGEKITIVGFGGSITQGAGRDQQPAGITHKYTDTKCYIDLVGDWFSDMFKSYGASVKTVNAGIGSTDTVFGIHRMGDDVLSYNPDLVIVEWDKNDNTESYKQATYENMVRKLLDKGIAVVMMGFCGGDGSSTQHMHEPIAKHYNLPYISYKNAFIGENGWLSKMTNDNVHPNIVGHHLAALIINSYFANVYKGIATASTEAYNMPSAPYHSDATIYSEGFIATFDDIEIDCVKGVEMVSKGSFVKEKGSKVHGPRNLKAYVAEYDTNYKPMILKISNLNTLFFLTQKNYGIADGSFRVEIDGVEEFNGTFNSAGGAYHDESQMKRSYVWATERAFYSSARKSITVKIYPTNKDKNEYVALYGLLLTGDFKADDTPTNEVTSEAPGKVNTSTTVSKKNEGTTVSTASSKKQPTASQEETEIVEDVEEDTVIEVEEVSKESFFEKNKQLLTVLIIVGAVIILGGFGFVIYLIVRK